MHAPFSAASGFVAASMAKRKSSKCSVCLEGKSAYVGRLAKNMSAESAALARKHALTTCVAVDSRVGVCLLR